MLSRKNSLSFGYATTSEDILQTETLPQLRRMASFTGEGSCPKESNSIGTPSSLSPYLRNKLLERRRKRLSREQTSSLHSLPAFSSLVSHCALANRLLFTWQHKSQLRNCPIETRPQRTQPELRQLFVRALRRLRVVVRMCLSIRSDRHERQEREMTMEEMRYYLMNDQHFSSEVMTLHYNKAEFAASNQVFMPRWARNVMQQLPGQRTLAEVKKLVMLLSNLKAFKHTFSSSGQEEFCHNCIYARYEKRRVIVKRGHPAEFCYIIFSGSVFVNIQDQDKDGRSFTRTECVMGEGSLFGEISLLHDMPRSATVVSREHTECVMVNREVLRKVCPDGMQREYTLKLDTIRQCPTFKEWPDEVIHQLCKHSKIEEYGYNKVVERNTHTAEFVYIVAAGRVEVMMALEPKYPTNGGDFLKGSEDLPTYLPGMKHPAPSVMNPAPNVMHCRDDNQPSHVFIDINTLLPHSICDLGSLLKDGDSRGLILVSYGATVMRIPKQQLAMATLSCWRALLAEARNSKRYPSDATLNRIFLEHYQWKLFKKLTVIDALDRQNGCLYATKAATKKGTSGAAVFPGTQRKHSALPRQAECLFCTNEVQLSPAEEEEAKHFLPRLT